MDCMTCVFDNGKAAVGDPCLHLLADLDELPIPFTGDDERGNLQRPQCRPHGLHRSSSKPAKGRRQSHRGVLQAVLLRFTLDVGKHRLGEPLVKERSQSDPLDPIRQGQVAFEPGGSCCPILDTSSASDQYESGDMLRVVERRAETKASAHGVPDVASGPDRFDDGACGFGKGRNSEVRKAMPREIDRLESCALYAVHDEFPGSTGLGEAVNKPDGRSRPDLVAMQHPTRIACCEG